VIVCPLRPMTLPTSDRRISILNKILVPCSIFVTNTSSGASTKCCITNSRKFSTNGSGLGSSKFFASLPHHAGNSLARLGAILHPVISAIQINLVVLSRFSRIVTANYFNKFTVAGTSFIRDYYPVKRSVLGALASQSNCNCHINWGTRSHSSAIF